MDAGTVDQASRFADEQKRAGAQRMDDIAQAVHRAADDIGNQMPAAAGYIHSAAARLESGAAALRDRSVGDLVSELSDLARREPAVLFGGAMLAGLALSRFLKSSSPRLRDGRSG